MEIGKNYSGLYDDLNTSFESTFTNLDYKFP